MATAMTISRSSGPLSRSDNSNNHNAQQQQQHSAELCPTCKQPLSSSEARHAAFSPESLPSIPLLPSINESGVSPPSARPKSSSLLSVDTSVTQNQDKQPHHGLSASPHTVGEEKAKARARGWSMVDEDAEKAKRELTWNRYRKLVQDVSTQESESDQQGSESVISVLKETLLKVLQEAEQLVRPADFNLEYVNPPSYLDP